MIMETLNIFNSIYFFIAFIIGAAFMLTMTITSMAEVKESRANARFFVTKGKSYDNHFALWLGKPEWNEITRLWIGRPKFVHFICNDYYFEKYNLNPADFADMKDDEIREVFINWED